MSNIAVLILAAGKGVRMKSSLPKVLHLVGGVPMVERVLISVLGLKPRQLAVVVGYGKDQVQEFIKRKAPRAKFFFQNVLDGSGGAVRRANQWLGSQMGEVVVTCGDAPLIKKETFRALLTEHQSQRNSVTVLTTQVNNPFGYGRIIRSFDGSVDRIKEELDATPNEKKVGEINTGTYCFDAKMLRRVLPKLRANNAKREYYLTDTLALLKKEGGRVGACVCQDPNEVMGINSRFDLAQMEGVLYDWKRSSLMASGVSFIDPKSCFVEEAVEIGEDTVIWPHTFILGKTKIGSRCEIGPWAHLKNCTLQNNVIFKASFAEASILQRGSRVGPYSHIRPGTELGPNVHLGNFSEVKKSRIGEGSKVNHLSYLGDAKIGKFVNIGAGSITCNYDGIRKYPTTIQDHVFVGSNSNLIAPLTLGAHCVVGAGSSLNEDVPAWALAVERSKTFIKKDWAKKRK